MEREMVRTEGGGRGEERIRNGRTDDVEGKGRGDRKRVEVKGGKKEEKKKWISFFCGVSPGCGSIKSIWGANSCQGLNPISLRGQQKVDKN